MHVNTSFTISMSCSGAGHAGCEAALGRPAWEPRPRSWTMNLDTIGQMSCNPAIAESPRGRSSGRSTRWGVRWARHRRDGHPVSDAQPHQGAGHAQPPRRQKKAIQFSMKRRMRSSQTQRPSGNSSSVSRRSRPVSGVRVRRRGLSRSAGVLTTGTFLQAIMHTGEAQTAGGRAGEGRRTDFRNAFGVGLRITPLKTGTPCR